MATIRADYRTLSNASTSLEDETDDSDWGEYLPIQNNVDTTTEEEARNDTTTAINNSHAPLLTSFNNHSMDEADYLHLSSGHHLQSIVPTLIISILLGLVSGTLYGFGRYARQLKTVLNFTQSQVQTLGICMDCGNYVGHPLTGLIYDRKGPVVSCLLAAVVVSAGYWRIRYTILNYFSQEEEELSEADSIWLNLAFCGVGFGSGLGYISGLGSTTKALLKISSNGGSYSKYFGTGIGLVAASYGLSSTLVGLSYHYLQGLPNFFLFWALTVPIVNLAAAVMFRMQANADAPGVMGAEESSSLQNYEQSYSSFTNLIRLASLTSLQSTPLDDAEPLPSFTNLVRLYSMNFQDPLLEQQQHQHHDSNATPAPTDSNMEELVNAEDAPCGTVAIWDSWKKLDFWLLFASFSCASGCGLLLINNLSTMVQSIGGSDSLAGTLIIILSVSNVSGRVLVGILGDSKTSTSPALRRIWLLQGVNLIMALAMLLGFVGGQHQLCLAIMVIMVALAYGGSWVLIVALASQLFGHDHFGKDYGLLALGPALSGLIFNEASARWYEEHATNNTCTGTACYETAYMAAGLVAVFGNVVTLILYKTQLQKEL